MTSAGDRLTPDQREHLRKLSLGPLAHTDLDAAVLAQLREARLIEQVLGGWKVTAAGLLALKTSR